jgi:hypothetical protein
MSEVAAQDLEFLRSSIAAWVERGYRLAFGYLGAIALVAAAAETGIGATLVDELEISRPVATFAALSLFNGLYLTLAGAVVVAILKRAYFIMRVAPLESVARRWECFTRREPDAETMKLPGKLSRIVRKFYWTADNMYVVPLYVIVWIFSVSLHIWVADKLSTGTDWLMVAASVVLHFLAFALAAGMIHWNRRCYFLVTDTDEHP